MDKIVKLENCPFECSFCRGKAEYIEKSASGRTYFCQKHYEEHEKKAE